ncbi:hypothetical protein GMORB2_2278 [Geosmithia morbida]|uniref:Uncharacterized protein n=1 Tax=Geosmithia morbida TaxID=1094350 RepID=A0A9P4YTD7_9HYPO|nr:uncharacterized protein GMORB2_2278 [Geosmithia morbida]KAF4121316.1 hypothetical protein GMORB2_2278 [Geosmithia morbida]
MRVSAPVWRTKLPVGRDHLLGGVNTWDASEYDDDSPERLGAVAEYSVAYLWSQPGGDGDATWTGAARICRVRVV